MDPFLPQWKELSRGHEALVKSGLSTGELRSIARKALWGALASMRITRERDLTRALMTLEDLYEGSTTLMIGLAPEESHLAEGMTIESLNTYE